MRPKIRPMRLDDIPEVVQIEQACQPHPWDELRFRRELANDRARLTVACNQGGLCGFLVCWLIAGEVEIHNICVAPACRRKGIARSLLNELFSSCLEAERFLLEVRRGNTAAIELYRQCGFHVDGIRPGYYHDGEDALLMSRPARKAGSGE